MTALGPNGMPMRRVGGIGGLSTGARNEEVTGGQATNATPTRLENESGLANGSISSMAYALIGGSIKSVVKLFGQWCEQSVWGEPLAGEVCLPAWHRAQPSATMTCRKRSLSDLSNETTTMALSEDQLRALVDDPRETLDVELKRWIDPARPEGIAKIAKGCMALRNSNGGFLVIGFMDNGKADLGNAPADVRASFHIDHIQQIVGKFSSEPFAVEVQFGERDGQAYPDISVPPGVRTPVAAKRDLTITGKAEIKDHAVYVRSLSSNNKVSSSEFRRGDLDRLVRICFDNREADIGGFVRRHLAALDLDRLGPLFTGLTGPKRLSSTDRAKELLDSGRARFRAALGERGVKLPSIGFRESAVVIDGEFPEFSTTESFLQRLFVAQPQHTGWPAWTDSRQFQSESDRPRVYDEAWETLVVRLESKVEHLDFWRINPAEGTFYLVTGLSDDLKVPVPKPEPGTQLDFLLQISRVAEVISIALSFARAMECEPSKTALQFTFRWSKLKGRHLTAWVQPQRSFPRVGQPVKRNSLPH